MCVLSPWEKLSHSSCVLREKSRMCLRKRAAESVYQQLRDLLMPKQIIQWRSKGEFLLTREGNMPTFKSF